MEVPKELKDLYEIYINYLVQTLENFTYRYLEMENSVSAPILPTGENTFTAQSMVTSLKEALKCPDEKVRQKIKDFVREQKGIGRPEVLTTLSFQFISLNSEGQGVVKVEAGLNWDYPEHTRPTQHAFYKTQEVDFQDLVQLKRLYPKALENICVIF